MTPERHDNPGVAAIIAIGAVGCSAQVGLLASPILVGAYLRGFGLTDGTAGLLVAVEFLGIFIASLVVSPRVSRLSMPALAGAGLILALAANLGVMAIDSNLPVLFLLRLIGGFGAGCGLCAANAALAALTRPIFAAGFMGALIIVLGTGIFASEQPIAALAGPRAVFLLSAAVALIGLVAAPLLPKRTPAKAASGTAFLSWREAALLAGYGLSFAATYAVWPYAERIGAALNVSASDINLGLGLSAVASLLGPGLAAALGERSDHRRLLIVGLVVTGIATLAFIGADSLVAFSGGAIALNIAVAFCAIEFMDLFARLDRTGRLGASSAAVNALGNAAGPAAGALAVTLGGFGLLTGISLIGLLLAGICIAWSPAAPRD